MIIERDREAKLRDFLAPFFLGHHKKAWKKGFSDEALAFVASQAEGLEWVREGAVKQMAYNFCREREEHELA